MTWHIYNTSTIANGFQLYGMRWWFLGLFCRIHCCSATMIHNASLMHKMALFLELSITAISFHAGQCHSVQVCSAMTASSIYPRLVFAWCSLRWVPRAHLVSLMYALLQLLQGILSLHLFCSGMGPGLCLW